MNNATLVAMLVYEADKDPVAMPHEVIATNPTNGQPISYACPVFPRRTADGR
jgi:hypothetical protein